MYRSFVFFAIVLLFGLTACEKVIDLDFGTTSSQLVIQGTVFDQPGPYTVRLIRSVDMDAAGVYPFVTGATVTISDHAGHSEQLAEGDSGRYTTSTLRGVPGRTYTLTVKTGGKAYTAVSTMSTISISKFFQRSFSPVLGICSSMSRIRPLSVL